MQAATLAIALLLLLVQGSNLFLLLSSDSLLVAIALLLLPTGKNYKATAKRLSPAQQQQVNNKKQQPSFYLLAAIFDRSPYEVGSFATLAATLAIAKLLQPCTTNCYASHNEVVQGCNSFAIATGAKLQSFCQPKVGTAAPQHNKLLRLAQLRCARRSSLLCWGAAIKDCCQPVDECQQVGSNR